MGRLFGLIILIIDILIVVEVLRSNKDPEKKAIWIAIVVLLPVLGPILYYFLGRGNAPRF
jgi:hypothetical protein